MRCSLVLLLVACGDNLPYEQAQDGARLHLYWWEFADGTRQARPFAPFFDTALGVECTRQVWRDGRARCTPTSAALMYSDEGCTTGVGASQQDTAAFHVTTLVDGVRRIEAMWLAGEEIATPPRLFAELDGAARRSPLRCSRPARCGS